MSRFSNPVLQREAERHLSDEQFYALLDRSPDSLAGGHVERCAACRDELAQIRASLSNLRLAVDGLAADTPARPSLVKPQAPGRLPRRPVSTPVRAAFGVQAWTACCATVLALVSMSITVVRPHWLVARPAASDGAARPAVSVAAQQASDEALLDGVEQDISTSIPPSLAPLAVPAESATRARN